MTSRPNDARQVEASTFETWSMNPCRLPVPPTQCHRLVLSRAIQDWSLTSFQRRLFKTGGRLTWHAQYFTHVLKPA